MVSRKNGNFRKDTNLVQSRDCSPGEIKNEQSRIFIKSPHVFLVGGWLPSVSPGDHPLTKTTEDSWYEIEEHTDVLWRYSYSTFSGLTGWTGNYYSICTYLNFHFIVFLCHPCTIAWVFWCTNELAKNLPNWRQVSFQNVQTKFAPYPWCRLFFHSHYSSSPRILLFKERTALSNAWITIQWV